MPPSPSQAQSSPSLPQLLLLLPLVIGVLSYQTCSFFHPGKFSITRTPQRCYSLGPSAYFSSDYIALAKAKSASLDLALGLPAQTNAFESSLVTGPAVAALLPHESRFLVPEVEAFTLDAAVVSTGVGRTAYRPASPRDAHLSLCGGIFEGSAFVPRGLEVLSVADDVFTSVAATGYVEIWGCQDVLTVRLCDYSGGRTVFANVTALPTEAVDVKCDVRKFGREGRKTDAEAIGSALFGVEDVGSDEIRRAVMVSLIVQNSASTAKCDRFVALPVACARRGFTWAGWSAVVLTVLGFVVRWWREKRTATRTGRRD